MDLTIPLATAATVGRIFLLIGLSIATSWPLAYLAIRHRWFENIYVPLVNIFESIPVIGFLPLVLTIFVVSLPGSLGIELAVDFLVFDAVVWNIWIGAYQAFKTVPESLVEVSDNYRFSVFKKLKDLYIPHSIPRITSNIFSSFADAFFYITVSEVFTAGVATAHLCPNGTCTSFGIGTLITNFVAAGDYAGVAWSLLAIAVAVILVTCFLSRASRWSVAKYGVNTSGEITRVPGKWWRRLVVSPWSVLTQNAKRITRCISPRRKGPDHGEEPPAGNAFWGRALTLFACGIGAVILAWLAISAVELVISIPWTVWSGYFAQTPMLLEYVAFDYIRVTVITLAAFVFAVFVGYYLATHRRIGDLVIPALQAFAAFPAPAYFPVLFILTVPFVEHAFPFLWTEVYIFILGFLSCFYYVFFDFWIGVQAVPVEFTEIAANYKIPFFTKMWRIILPSSLPYLITGLSSTINSAWAGIAIGEYWPAITPHGPELSAPNGMMYYISSNMAAGQIGAAAYVSLLFAIVVALYGIFFTRNLMDLARKKYVVEEGIFAA